MKSFFQICLLALLLQSCAQIVTPTGGPKDEEPPILDTLNATPNYQTNFQKQQLEFPFDEWIQLKDAGTQVVVSPPLQYKKTVDIRKKTVRFNFDEREVLRENATYTINFGKAIQDFTAGNPAEFRFVFSTGDFIDSLEVSGKIVDAFTGEPLEDVVLMLYDNLSDTVVRTEKPFYFGRSDETGRVTIQNVRADTFKVFALLDNDLSLTYSSASEQIGFVDSFLVVNDSTTSNLQIRLSQETEPLKLREETAVQYGKFNLEFNREPSDAIVTHDGTPSFFWSEKVADSLHVWYNDLGNQQWFFYVENGGLIDTIFVENGEREAAIRDTSLQLFEQQGRVEKINPSKALRLKFAHPLAAFDGDLIQIFADTTKTLEVPKVALDSSEKRTLIIQHNWREGLPYQVQILPDALLDIFGIANQDTLLLNYQTQSKKDFGNLDLTIDNLDSLEVYQVEILDKKENIIEAFSIKNETIYRQIFNALPPDTYTLRIIEDTNRDGHWTPASYDLQRQPERIFSKQLEELRANWDVEARISLDN